jgi:hypothetical protein
VSTAGKAHQLATYQLPDGTTRALIAQRINGHVAITDLPLTDQGRVYLVERHIESTAAMHGLTNAYIEDSLRRGEPAALLPAELQHNERRARFAALKSRERRDLLLHAGGYTYTEIAQRTGSTYTAVISRRLRQHRPRRWTRALTTCRRSAADRFRMRIALRYAARRVAPSPAPTRLDGTQVR